jgi:hypothetical protein
MLARCARKPAKQIAPSHSLMGLLIAVSYSRTALSVGFGFGKIRFGLF